MTVASRRGKGLVNFCRPAYFFNSSEIAGTLLFTRAS